MYMYMYICVYVMVLISMEEHGVTTYSVHIHTMYNTFAT